MSTNKEHSQYTIFDQLIDNHIPFSLFRRPKESEINLVLQTDSHTPTNLTAIEELDGKRGFIISPFAISADKPIVLIKDDVNIKGEADIFAFLSGYEIKAGDRFSESCSVPEEDIDAFDSYKNRFRQFYSALDKGIFRKLVLSRTVCKSKPSASFSAGVAFRKACDKYPDNFVFLCHTPISGSWLGCSPEILISGHAGQWQTDALAGTQRNTSLADVAWDNKNREEQQIVSDYMQKQLAAAGIQSMHGQPHTIGSGNLVHLKTEFRFSTSKGFSIGKLLHLLHPSPAVCGFPKEEAQQFILQNEGYDRSYYSGFVGYMDMENSTDLFVNLRCMQIHDNCLQLYAGGGLLTSSDVNEEWKETEDKLQTILSIIN